MLHVTVFLHYTNIREYSKIWAILHESISSEYSFQHFNNITWHLSPTSNKKICGPSPRSATSMLVTEVGDEMCWFWDIVDGFGRFCHQHPLSFNISVGHKQPKDVTNIEILSLTSTNCHQHLYSPEITFI